MTEKLKQMDLGGWTQVILALAAFVSAIYVTQYRLDRIEHDIEELQAWRLGHVSESNK